MQKMSPLQLNGAIFALFFLTVSVQSSKNWMDLLKVEQEVLKEDGHECADEQVQKRDAIYNAQMARFDGASFACLIKYVDDNPLDGFMWSMLGTAFLKKGTKFQDQALISFKRANKIDGFFLPLVKEWHFIGPFAIGKSEFDGDPIESFGGIANVSLTRWKESVVYPSELVPHGNVGWMTVEHPKGKPAKVVPKVNWNELVSSLQSMGITEWQGWVVSDFPVNQDNVTVVVKCMGASTVLFNGIPITGDVYHRNKYRFPVHLNRGVHLIAIKLRAKVEAVFQCSFETLPKGGFEVLEPNFVPDMYNGYLFSRLLAFPVSNLRADKWLTVLEVSVMDHIHSGEEGTIMVVGSANEVPEVDIAPGQTRFVNVGFLIQKERVSEKCYDVPIGFRFNTTGGVGFHQLLMRCRERRGSFIFTFMDHDGSVQHAAAIEPRGSCKGRKCPVLLSLHGTTVPPQNQADAYKRMVDDKFQFGVEGMWVLAPTRFGAHNWEGPGALTAMHALENLAQFSKNNSWLKITADPQRVLFEGHSMGGHGAWHLATHYPDHAIGLAALSGWIKKEEYGDSNLFFRGGMASRWHDIATSHTDASVKAVMEACIGENDADRHVSNLWNIPVLCRIGGSDRTVHPFFTRRMYRLLQEQNTQVTFSELEGKEHWWWDTWKTNDGGVMNDEQMRSFAADCLKRSGRGKSTDQGSCSKDDEDCEEEEETTSAESEDLLTGDAELVVMNPALGEGLRGVRVLQQSVPFRTSKIEMRIMEKEVKFSTTNVLRFTISEPTNRPVKWVKKKLWIDGQGGLNVQKVLSKRAHICKTDDRWALCDKDLYDDNQRGPLTYGPARRVAENKFVIVVGTKGKANVVEKLTAYATYIANLFLLTSDIGVHIMKDTDYFKPKMVDSNVILVGSPQENSVTNQLLEKVPVKIVDGKVQLGTCHFTDKRTGVLTLAPHGSKHLALILMGTSMEGLYDVVSLATPTIPPMARSPFSNLLPDFVITGDNFRRHGPGGFLCAGFWGNQWELRQDTVSCACGGGVVNSFATVNMTHKHTAQFV